MQDLQDWDAPTLVISGRVDPRDIERAARFLREEGVVVKNKSELVSRVFEYLSRFAEIASQIDRLETNHEALEELHAIGLEWPEGSHGRDLRKVLQWDVIGDLSVKDAIAYKNQVMDQRRKGANLMPSAVSSDPLDNMMGELEELDKELRGGGATGEQD